MEVFAESTGDAWEKLSLTLLNSGEETTIQDEPVREIRWRARPFKSLFQTLPGVSVITIRASYSSFISTYLLRSQIQICLRVRKTIG